jgi:D-glycero-D-manno-heptose 1,7-bisphosphate phosphatase
MSAPPRPCIFFDRDGIANVSPTPAEYYVLSVDRFFVVPAFIESLRIVEARNYAAVIVTNQLGLEKGLLSPETLEAIHARLRAEVDAAGTQLLDIYVCPHAAPHPDRKPAPGMLLRAARDHGLDLSRSWMIGDAERDIAAGKAAGCACTLLVSAESGETQADYRLDTMDALPGFLRKHLPANVS